MRELIIEKLKEIEKIENVKILVKQGRSRGVLKSHNLLLFVKLFLYYTTLLIFLQDCDTIIYRYFFFKGA